MKTNTFEIILVTEGGLTPEENQKIVEKFSDILQKKDGTIVSHADWGRRRLAYAINKKNWGHFNFFFVTGNGAMIEEFHLQCGYDEQIIKSFVVSVADADKALKDFDALKEDPKKNSKLITESVGV